MSDGPEWKGQVEMLHFDLEQVTAIASATRSDIFWSFSADKPMSAQDVAKEVGKSAQAVRYHINELVKVGLLLPVEHRKKRSRTEEAYVQAARAMYYEPKFVSEAYEEQMIRGFDSMTRYLAKEHAAGIRARNLDSNRGAFQAFVRWSVHLNPERARQVKQILLEALREAGSVDEDKGTRVTMAVYMSASLGESRRFLAFRSALGRGSQDKKE